MVDTRSRPYRAGRWFGRALVTLVNLALILVGLALILARGLAE